MNLAKYLHNNWNTYSAPIEGFDNTLHLDRIMRVLKAIFDLAKDGRTQLSFHTKEPLFGKFNEETLALFKNMGFEVEEEIENDLEKEDKLLITTFKW